MFIAGRYVPSCENDAALGGFFQLQNTSSQGGFAAAALPDDGKSFAPSNLQAHTVNGPNK